MYRLFMCFSKDSTVYRFANQSNLLMKGYQQVLNCVFWIVTHSLVQQQEQKQSLNRNISKYISYSLAVAYLVDIDSLFLVHNFEIWNEGRKTVH